MVPTVRPRLVRKLEQAEGFLMLEMPAKALELLKSRPDWGPFQFEAGFLTGEALRALGRFAEALPHLERAAHLRKGHLGVAICLGWCYKRTHRLAQAIDALEEALRVNPGEALLHYNLACYWSLANNPERALDALAEALGLDPSLGRLLAAEPDFERLRGVPDFDRLVADEARPA